MRTVSEHLGLCRRSSSRSLAWHFIIQLLPGGEIKSRLQKAALIHIGVSLTETELSAGRRLWQESSGMGWWQTKSQAHLPAALHAQSTRDWNFELNLAVIAFEIFPEILHFPGSNPHNLCNIPLYFENELFSPFPLDKLPFERSVQQEMLTSRPRLNQS